MLVVALILALVLSAVATAVLRVASMQQLSDTMYATSGDLRAAVNMIGEDVRYALAVSTPTSTSLVVHRYGNAVAVQYYMTPAVDAAGNVIAGEYRLIRDNGPEQLEVVTGLDSRSQFAIVNKGARVLLSSKKRAGRVPSLAMATTFFPQGAELKQDE